MSLADVPICGLTCLSTSLANTTCPLTDQTCLCGDAAFANAVAACVIAKCSIGEQLAVKIFSAKNCQLPVVDRSYIIGTLQIVFTILQDVSFLLRILSKFMHLLPWGPDDTTIVIAFILQNIFLAGGIIAAHLGLGVDSWGLSTADILSVMKLFFTFEFLYSVTLGVVKMSICFLYFRIFPDRRFRRWLWATQLFNILLTLTFVLVSMLQCRPISWFWDRLDGMTTQTGRCVDLGSVAIAQGVLALALDLWMLVLPATQIWGLQMAWKKKMRVQIMFALGIFLTAISTIRIRSLIIFKRTDNPTQGFLDISIWSCIELTVGVIVACLPSNLQLMRYWAPSVQRSFISLTSRSRASSKQRNTNKIKMSSSLTWASDPKMSPRHQRHNKLIKNNKAGFSSSAAFTTTTGAGDTAAMTTTTSTFNALKTWVRGAVTRTKAPYIDVTFGGNETRWSQLFEDLTATNVAGADTEKTGGRNSNSKTGPKSPGAPPAPPTWPLPPPPPPPPPPAVNRNYYSEFRESRDWQLRSLMDDGDASEYEGRTLTSMNSRSSRRDSRWYPDRF